MADVIHGLRPCKDCDNIEPLRDKEMFGPYGYCRKTNSIQILDEPWFCDSFETMGQKLHPKVRFKYAKRQRRKRKKSSKAGGNKNR